jgi:two-component system sensor histidine kinase DegS
MQYGSTQPNSVWRTSSTQPTKSDTRGVDKMVLSTEVKSDSWEAFQVEMQTELDQSRRALNEINLMLEQSQQELNKLAQRNTAITVHLQQIQAQMDSLPRADIRMAYDAALDSQQRLFVLRSQLDKLQSDQTHLNRLIYFLEHTQELMSGGKPVEQQPRLVSNTANVEMLINAQETERQRLSRQMHDGPAQALSNFILQTEIAARLFDMDQGRAKDELANLKLAAMSTFQKVRNFIFELRPMMLDDLGLIPTVKRYVDTYKEQTGIDLNLNITGAEHRLEPYIEVMIFRALQDLLAAAVQTGQANQVKITVNNEDALVKVSVEDNGKGIDPAIIDKEEGLSLHMIKERAEMLGGSMQIDSRTGQGTRITLEIPTEKSKTGV